MEGKNDTLFILAIVAAGGLIIWWFIHKGPISTNPLNVTARPPQPSTADQLMAYSTAGCQVGSKAAGVPMPGNVCAYTPFNIAVKNRATIASVGGSLGKGATNALGTVTSAPAAIWRAL